MTEHNFEQMRRAMVASQLRTTAVNDPRVVAAMGKVAREDYVPAEQRPLAYLDATLSLGDGRALPMPMVLGRLLTEARVKPDGNALVIGTAPDYAAAVLAELTGRVSVASGDLTAGAPEGAPYDLILIDGAVEHVPTTIVDQLAEGGTLATGLVEGGVTRLAVGRKAGGGFGLLTFADAEVPVLPGFTKPAGFRF